MKHHLDFEKPILELQRKLDEMKRHPEAHSLGISLDQEIAQIEKKISETRRDVFLNLTAWQRVQMARHPKRPYTLDYLRTTFSCFTELHGDRAYSDDRAVVGGFARLEGEPVMVVGTQKGTGHQGEHPAQFRIRASGGIPQGAPFDAVGGEVSTPDCDVD